MQVQWKLRLHMPRPATWLLQCIVPENIHNPTTEVFFGFKPILVPLSHLLPSHYLRHHAMFLRRSHQAPLVMHSITVRAPEDIQCKQSTQSCQNILKYTVHVGQHT